MPSRIQYRVRLLSEPVMPYNGHSYELASQWMERHLGYDRTLERRVWNEWCGWLWQTCCRVEGSDA